MLPDIKNENTPENLLAEGMSLLSEHGYHGTGLKKSLPASVTKIISDKLVFEGHTFDVYKELRWPYPG